MGGSSAPAHSSSTISATEVTGSHVLTVESYTTSKGLLSGQSFGSSTFAAAGHRWSIVYYPKGDVTFNADYISLFLYLAETKGPGVKARYRFSLLDSKGEPVPSYSFSSWTSTFVTCSDIYSKGWPRFIKRKALEKSAFLCNDFFRIRCDITVVKGIVRDTNAAPAPAPAPTATRFVAVPPPNMGQHLGRLLSSGEGADVTFEVDGETIKAHRSILAARSPVFKAKLFDPMSVNNSVVCVWVDGMEARVFKAVLHFVYTDSLPAEVEDSETKVTAQQLLVAADRYGLERLKLMCEDKLCDCIDTSNVGTVLALAEQHGCHGLKKACLDFLMSGSNLKAAIASGGFVPLTNSCPSVLNELHAKVAL